MKSVITFLIFSGWYLTMAIGGSVLCAIAWYFRVNYFGFDANTSDSLTVPMEMTAAMMSGILISGKLYCRFMPCDNIDDMNKFMNWRIQMLHIITVISVIIDIFL